MGTPPRISEAEWQVMSVIWDEHPLTAREVTERLAEERDWTEHTVKTLISRLVKKGALRYRKEGKRYLYRPRVTRSECVRAASDSFRDRIFGGSTSPLVAHFVREGNLSPAEIDQLRRLLDEKEAEA